MSEPGNLHRTPDQILGPFYPTRQRFFAGTDLTQTESGGGLARGEIIEVRGRILNLEGEPIRGARLSIWQANSVGRYRHINDRSAAPLDPNFVGSTSIRSKDDGSYAIKTVKPGAYAAIEDWTRPPHVHFEVHGRFERLVTQMYFPGEPLNERDRVLAAALRPDLLVAAEVKPQQPRGPVFNFDIVLVRG